VARLANDSYSAGPQRLSWDGRNNDGSRLPSGVYFVKLQVQDFTSVRKVLPTNKLMEAIDAAFGSFVGFKEQFSKTAVGTFGSGWAWLVKNDDGSLILESTSNADTPVKSGKTPLLTCDVWEHAYYVDYRNARPGYVGAFWNLVNWEFVANNAG